MTSEKQTAANRENAQKSTGPRTREGKAIARRNALKHGLLSDVALVPGEQAADLADLCQRLRAELKPVGTIEHLLVDRVASGLWRLRRCLRLEAGVVESEEARVEPYYKDYLIGEVVRRTQAEMRQLRAIRVTDEGDRLERMLRYETAIERQVYRALAELERRQLARGAEAESEDDIIDAEAREVEEPPKLPAPEDMEMSAS